MNPSDGGWVEFRIRLWITVEAMTEVATGMDLQILALVGAFPYLVMINLTLIKLRDSN